MPAPARAMVKLPEIEVDVGNLMRVLWIDDDDDFRASLARLLEGWGYRVDQVSTPEEAIALLEREKYALVIADVNFDNSRMSGDEFIVFNKERMRSARVIAITGKGTDIIARRDELIEMGVEIIQKGGGHGMRIRTIAESKIAESREYLVSRVKDSIPGIIDGEYAHAPLSAAYYLAKDLEDDLVRWLESREDPSAKTISYGDRMYSTYEMAMEIRVGSEVGRAHLRMLAKIFKRSVGII